MLSADRIEAILTPIDPSRPCGVDLRHDAVCSHLFDEPKGQERQDFVNGKQIIIVDPPDWPKINKDLTDVMGRTRDLRLWILQLRAWTVADGLEGAALGLRLIADGVERFWPGLHPELDPTEPVPEDQALKRLNALRALVDPRGLISELKRSPLVKVEGFGAFSLRDIDLASGRLPPAQTDVVPEMGRIEAAFLECDPAELIRASDMVAAAIADVDRLVRVLADRLGADPGIIDVAMLRRLLEQIRTVLGDHAKAATIAAGDRPGDGQPPPGRANGAAMPSPWPMARKPEPAAGDGPMSATLDSRDDVLVALDRILDYYCRREPSSPIPILVERIKRLVKKDFLALIEDLAPSAMKQIREIGGLDGKPPDEARRAAPAKGETSRE